MKHILIIALGCLTLTACAGHGDDEKKTGWLFDTVPPKEWPEKHWEGQNFKPSLEPQEQVLRTSVNRDQTMFSNIDGLKPDDFITNLKQADIITSVQNIRTGFFNQTVTDDIAIYLGSNFYTLSYDDQTIVTELLAKSYNQDNYILKDGSTKKVVGQITKNGFKLY